MGRFATFESSRVNCPSQPASTNPAVEWMRSPNRPRLLFPSKRATRSSGRTTLSRVLPSTNSPGWRIKGCSSLIVTSSVRSYKFCFTSMMPIEWFLKTLNWESILRSTELGWIAFSPSGSIIILPESKFSLIVLSERITLCRLVAEVGVSSILYRNTWGF